MHQIVRSITARTMTTALVPFASPKNSKARVALEIAIKEIINRVILSIFDMRNAASTVV